MKVLRPLSAKQKSSILDSNAKINIWEGAVRSGKTISCILRWIDFCKNGPDGDFMVCGYTVESVERNIIKVLEDLCGSSFRYSHYNRKAYLFNRLMYIVGADDSSAERRIQGSTLAGALVDEIVNLPKGFYDMLYSRLSVSGSKLFATCNPSSPFHWLKTETIDTMQYPWLRVFHFDLDDNPDLDEDYKEGLRKKYTGLWYQRYVEGKWVLAEGTVFDFFDRERHVISYPPGVADYYIVGVDYGTTNPTAFSLIGYSKRTYPNIWLEKEYYWDSRKEFRQKTDTDYAEDLQKFCQGYNVKQLYMDPSAVSFRVELQRSGFSGMIEANNDVLDGIRFHSKMLGNGTFKICHNCSSTIQEYGTYRWDSKASLRGEDRPLKDNDHMMDSIRYALYTHFKDGGGQRLSAEDLDRLRAEAYGYSQHGKFFDENLW
jgi:PBSX family phage terminase large subunit